MTMLYPLRFQPIFRRYLWGGRRLGTVLNKPIGDESDYAESWELVDRGADQSVISNGPLSGTTLGQLVREHGEELLGLHHPQVRFPLLVKLLDAHTQLSVQVHPDDAHAALLSPPDFGKTEAWVILAAEPGSYLYAGLRRGFDRHALEREISRGTCELCLHRVEPRVGDCFFLEAGTVHALGPGLLVAEIQQSSDTTYRLYDWNRLGPDGKPRALHVDQGLEVTNFDAGPVHPCQPQSTDQTFVERLVSSEKFILDRRRIDAPQSLGGDDRCHIMMVIEGTATISGDPSQQPLHAGDVALLPASAGTVEVTALKSAVILDAYLP
jgi:mannose-6-phosphate isomerase